MTRMKSVPSARGLPSISGKRTDISVPGVSISESGVAGIDSGVETPDMLSKYIVEEG